MRHSWIRAPVDWAYAGLNPRNWKVGSQRLREGAAVVMTHHAKPSQAKPTLPTALREPGRPRPGLSDRRSVPQRSWLVLPAPRPCRRSQISA